MYFPYFRGKRYELYALRECSVRFSKSKKIIPVIEPVRENPIELAATLELYEKVSAPFVLITNPAVGQLRYQHETLNSLLADGAVPVHARAFFGHVVSQDSNLGQVESFLRRYEGRPVSLIHTSDAPQAARIETLCSRHGNVAHQVFIEEPGETLNKEPFLRHPRVLIRDEFRRKSKNGDYGGEDFFSDLHRTYAASGLQGFGDFSVIGRKYRDRGGGRAHAVVIHLTYLRTDGDIWVKHFVSDTVAPKAPKRMFQEAVKKLVDFLDATPDFFHSTACDEFRKLHRKKSFPGLGAVKKLSIRHHMELMARIL